MASGARIISIDPDDPGVQIVFDTGEDSMFLWYRKDAEVAPEPDMVGVHTHGGEVDETIVMIKGEGYYLHGKTPETVVKSPFKAPCLLYLPADEYHRIINTGDVGHEGVLMYSLAGATIEKFSKVIGRAVGAQLKFAELPVEELPAESSVQLRTG